MATAERALAFAIALDSSVEEIMPKTLSEREKRIVLDAAHVTEIAAILRHYAEILPKWQAVLDAEAAFTIRLWSYKQDPTMQNFDLEYETMADGVYQLIIKPAP